MRAHSFDGVEISVGCNALVTRLAELPLKAIRRAGALSSPAVDTDPSPEL